MKNLECAGAQRWDGFWKISESLDLLYCCTQVLFGICLSAVFKTQRFVTPTLNRKLHLSIKHFGSPNSLFVRILRLELGCGVAALPSLLVAGGRALTVLE